MNWSYVAPILPAILRSPSKRMLRDSMGEQARVPPFVIPCHFPASIPGRENFFPASRLGKQIVST
jgi:hypothetical protein